MLRNVVFFLIFLGAATFLLRFEGKLPAPDPLKIEAGKRERFWQLKVRDETKANVVIMGDSRANFGVSPDALIAELPGAGWRGRNLALSGGGLNSEMYEFIESRVEFESPRPPIIVIGVTPLALTGISAGNDHFKTLMSRSWLHAQAYIHFPRITGMLSREEPDFEIQIFGGQNEYNDNGWQGALRELDRWPDAWLKGAKRRFKIDGIKPELQRGLMEQVRAWSGRGIRVYGFFPPASPAMRKIEIEETGFDEDGLARDFAEAGGFWIDIDHEDYRTYDNSHLSRAEAERMSREIGRAIARALDP